MVEYRVVTHCEAILFRPECSDKNDCHVPTGSPERLRLVSSGELASLGRRVVGVRCV